MYTYSLNFIIATYICIYVWVYGHPLEHKTSTSCHKNDSISSNKYILPIAPQYSMGLGDLNNNMIVTVVNLLGIHTHCF